MIRTCKVMITGILVLLVAILAILGGCIDMQELEEGIFPTATPTSGQQVLEPSGTQVMYVGGDTPSEAGPSTKGYVKTPFGYNSYESQSTPRITLIEAKAETDDSGRKYITGKIKNEAPQRIDHITIVFNLYNSNGNLLGNAYASVDYLGSGKIWKFTTNTFESKEYQFFEMAEIFSV
ncbi:MAG TPA: FxLYD domain-containing protein [Methanoregulaceae archaeon]|nr:FxLYD domain-containing protein [Methanoregulaceae archaeon]